MPKPSHLAVLGVGKETVAPGTPAAPSMWVPWKTLTPTDDVDIISDEGVRGAPVDNYGQSTGMKGSSLDLGGDVFADTLGWLLASVLPDVVTTGSAAPYSTVFSTLCTGDTQPTPQTWTIVDGLAVWQYPGQQFSELSFKWNADGYFSWTAKSMGWTYVSGTMPTPSFAAAPKPIANWATVTKIAGVATFVQDGEVTIKRNMTAIKGPNGSQNPYRIFTGDVSVEGKLTLVPEDITQVTAYQAGTSQAFEVSYSQGTAGATNGLILHCSNVTYTAATASRGKDYIELPVSFKASANTSDIGASGGWSPIKATLTNAIASGTYK